MNDECNCVFVVVVVAIVIVKWNREMMDDNYVDEIIMIVYVDVSPSLMANVMKTQCH